MNNSKNHGDFHVKQPPVFKRQQVRDLAWVMNSPGLLSAVPAGGRLVADDWCHDVYQGCITALQQLEQDPAPLEAWLAQRYSHRLGVYFESLLAYWLQQLLGVGRLHCNVPLYSQPQGGKKRDTLGEFDFLFCLPGENLARHWELTVKFYLLHSGQQGSPCWTGPGGHDRLDLKLERIFNHQLQLSRTAEAQLLLQELELPAPRAEAFIKGWLFYPLDSSLSPVQDNMLSRHHLRGWWLRVSQLREMRMRDCEAYLILSRSRWLSPLVLGEEDVAVLEGRQALLDYCGGYFARSDESLLVAELVRQGDSWTEAGRGFVVSDSWPVCRSEK